MRAILSLVDRDTHFMERALALARATVGQASPNPQVGCVLVRPGTSDHDDLILGEGAHLYDQRDHAEIAALKHAASLGNHVRGATAYVTLEPCSHHGRTGPCADALIAAGIARCVVATEDPNPLVSGQGLAKLRAAGIALRVGVGQQQARELNLAFAYAIQYQRPFITLKAALSAEGYLAPPPETRRAAAPHWLTGPEARAEVHRLRHASDAILTGIGTVLADDPALTDRSGLPRRRPLLRVILDPQLRTPTTSQLIRSAAATVPPQEPDLVLLCAPTAPPEREQQLLKASHNRVEIVRLPAGPAGRLSLPAIPALLADRLCRSLLLETGSALNSAFLHEDLVDRVVLFFSGTSLGPGSVPFAAAGPSPYLLQQKLAQLQTQTIGADTMVTGLLHDPWPPASLSGRDHQTNRSI